MVEIISSNLLRAILTIRFFFSVKLKKKKRYQKGQSCPKVIAYKAPRVAYFFAYSLFDQFNILKLFAFFSLMESKPLVRTSRTTALSSKRLWWVNKYHRENKYYWNSSSFHLCT